MAGQVIFFNKSKCDFKISGVSTEASQGDDYSALPLNRSNSDGWITNGSQDSDNTTWEVDFGESRSVSDIILIKHNFKAFTIQYYNGITYADFSTPIAETTNEDETNYYTFEEVSTQKIKITITGTIVADADKIMRQFIATTKIGQLEGWPIIDPTLSRNKVVNTMISGKKSIRENIGARKEILKIKTTSSDNDLSIVEALVYSDEGFLYWPCGGDEDQFSSKRIGWRLEDIYLMKMDKEYSPQWYQGLYKSGMEVNISLYEVVD